MKRSVKIIAETLLRSEVDTSVVVLDSQEIIESLKTQILQDLYYAGFSFAVRCGRDEIEFEGKRILFALDMHAEVLCGIRGQLVFFDSTSSVTEETYLPFLVAGTQVHHLQKLRALVPDASKLWKIGRNMEDMLIDLKKYD